MITLRGRECHTVPTRVATCVHVGEGLTRLDHQDIELLRELKGRHDRGRVRSTPADCSTGCADLHRALITARTR